MKVDVWSGDGKTRLGRGELTEMATAYVFVTKDGALLSSSSCEEKPSEHDIAEMVKDGAELLELVDNPKIVLENGKVVYGCQVWWQPLEDIT